MRKAVLVTALLGAGFFISCGGGGGGTEVADYDDGLGSGTGSFVNVSGQIVSQVGANSLQAQQVCAVSIEGRNPAYIAAVAIDQNGRLTAAGSSIDQNCNFNLALNSSLRYVLVLFDENRLPIKAVVSPDGGTVVSFSGDVNLTIGVDGNGQLIAQPDNPNNVRFSQDPNAPGTAIANAPDRNGNNIPDYMDDLDGNSIPDAMEDKNRNNYPDSLEDWDNNGIPEGLEDENDDGIPDHIEDSDHDGRPEYHDCDEDGRFIDDPDEREYEGEEGYNCASPTQPSTSLPNNDRTPDNDQAQVSFSADVYPILSQRCLSCHGNNGNFSLGNSVTDAYSNITTATPATQGYASFINTNDPQNSLLLLKATNQINHGGGQVIQVGSTEYQILLNWIQQGAQNN